MKAPAFVGRLAGAIASAARGGSARLAGLAGALARAVAAMASAAAATVAGADKRVRLIAASAAAAVLCCVVALAILTAAKAGARIDEAVRPTESSRAGTVVAKPVAGVPVRGVPAVPRSGPGLASMLVIPGVDDWPWPLALEPKARYTEADAAAVRPDLGAIDVSDLSARRKAELETIFSAVD